MRLSVLLTRLTPFLLVLTLIAACGGPPPTEYVIITSTPNGTLTPTNTDIPAVTVVIVTATPDPAQVTLTPTLQLSPTGTEVVEQVATPTFSQIQVAEQPFENGRMFWLEPIDQIWVMIQNENDNRSGIWMVFPDNFEEGDVEIDPKIVAPEGLLQPERGFGKLWRDNPDVREALGWAKQGEIGHVSNYQYHPSGKVVNGEFASEFGYHILTSGYGNKTFRFNEINATWQQLDK